MLLLPEQKRTDRATRSPANYLPFATRLVRGGTDLVIAAELLGHARLKTTRVYARPTDEDRANALNLLDVDE